MSLPSRDVVSDGQARSLDRAWAKELRPYRSALAQEFDRLPDRVRSQFLVPETAVVLWDTLVAVSNCSLTRWTSVRHFVVLRTS